MPPGDDERVYVDDVDLDAFETFLAVRGERSRPRITYLDGVLELMSPSIDHERIKTRIAVLLEAYLLELGVTFQGYGSWTLRRPGVNAAAEADECYMIGREPTKDRPDLAIEVVWTSGGLDKLEVYRRLKVREVWFWIAGRIEVYALGDAGYERHARSPQLPALDFALLLDLIDTPFDSDAILALRARLPARR
jgi:Uma2 family endonuclease